jgi:hypothetical protein
MKVRLAVSSDLWIARRLMGSCICSVCLHGALLAAVLTCYPVEPAHAPGGLIPKYRVQMLELAPPAVAQEAPKSIFWPLADRRRAAAFPNQSPALQTLVVEGAPPRLKLKRRIPLPAIASWTATRPTAPNLKPDALQPPQLNIISLPDDMLLAQGAITVPVVNQWAVPWTSSSVDTGSPPDSPPQAPDASRQETSGHQAGATLEGAPGGTLTRIELPPDSGPRTSVLGESVAEQYPEAADQMRSQAVSTIYLSMGLKKSWILEYWSEPVSEIQKGGTAALEAPWPYVMFRPDIVLPAEADALLVRGVLTAEGHLEHLALLLPAEWAQKDSLFRALEQWKFRPASHNGLAEPVEVLLVIPRQPEE